MSYIRDRMEEGRGGVIYGEVIVTEEEGIYQNQGTGRGGGRVNSLRRL